MSAEQENRDKFIKWLNNKTVLMDVDTVEKACLSGLQGIGVTVSTIFDEMEPINIRLMASGLVIKREQCKIAEFGQYSQAILFLVAYAEFLEHRESPVDPAHAAGSDKTKDSLAVAYYLSRVNMKAVHDLGYRSFSEAFNKLAEILGQKPSTIKNMRDEFDPYFDNGRVGWYQRQLRASRKEIFEKFKDISDEALADVVKTILSSYGNASSKKSDPKKHKTIKIKNSGMKEIKAGKR